METHELPLDIAIDELSAAWQRTFRELRKENARCRILRRELRQENEGLRAELEALRARVGQ